MIRKGNIVWDSPASDLPQALEQHYFDLVESPAVEELEWLGLAAILKALGQGLPSRSEDNRSTRSAPTICCSGHGAAAAVGRHVHLSDRSAW